MGKIEYINYVNVSMSEINALVDQLYESMMDREDEAVLLACKQITEKINQIKETGSLFSQIIYQILHTNLFCIFLQLLSWC